jgi:hypothetical protein
MVFCSALILMGSLDWLITIIGILNFGAVEVNPLFSGITKTNLLAYSGIKLSMVALTGFLFYKLGNIEKMSASNSHFGKRFVESGYSVTLMALTAVVTNNIIAVVKVM